MVDRQKAECQTVQRAGLLVGGVDGVLNICPESGTKASPS